MAEPLTALVLTSPPSAGGLDAATLSSLRSNLKGCTTIEESWLGDGEAWQALFVPEDGMDLKLLRARLAASINAPPIDVNIVPGADAWRRKKLLVADMEATIIEQECLDELASYVGLRDRISGITKRAMRGELDFESALKERVALLKDLGSDVLETVYSRISLMPGAATLVATMRQHGATCALVSGGFTFFATRVAARLGFDTCQANVLELAGGRVAGTVAVPILGREAKQSMLERLRREMGLAESETLAVGDGANDLGMIKAAGLGVAFRAKPIVAAEAQASIVHGDLTALLYLQGFRKEEFVS
jgi:phosphoserine phosphatase